MLIKIYPVIGDTYYIIVNTPDIINDDDVTTYIDNWIEDHLKNVDYYEIL